MHFQTSSEKPVNRFDEPGTQKGTAELENPAGPNLP
ncbi:MAG: hypothetical protein ACI9VR_002590 [Cognaticolwellia sp.]|jgi:hypothetical protein